MLRFNKMIIRLSFLCGTLARWKLLRIRVVEYVFQTKQKMKIYVFLI